MPISTLRPIGGAYIFHSLIAIKHYLTRPSFDGSKNSSDNAKKTPKIKHYVLREKTNYSIDVPEAVQRIKSMNKNVISAKKKF